MNDKSKAHRNVIDGYLSEMKHKDNFKYEVYYETEMIGDGEVDSKVNKPLQKYLRDIVYDEKDKAVKKKTKLKFGGSVMFDKIFGSFYFGPVKNSKFRMSPMGVAMKQKDDSWVCYDSKKDAVTNVADITFDMDDMFYQIPVNVVHPGDLILHKGEPVYVKEITKGTPTKGSRIFCYHVERNEEIVIYPEKSIMGNFLFFTKIISIMNLMGATGEDGGDFTKMNPMMFMFMGQDSENGMFGGKMKDLMMMQMMGGLFNNGMDGTNLNQLLPFMMFSGNQEMDMFEMMMMMQMMNGNGSNPMEGMGDMFGTMFNKPAEVKTSNESPSKGTVRKNKTTK